MWKLLLSDLYRYRMHESTYLLDIRINIHVKKIPSFEMIFYTFSASKHFTESFLFVVI